VRLVFPPLEAHGYAARESPEHMLWEMDNWLDTLCKELHAGEGGGSSEARDDESPARVPGGIGAESKWSC